MKNSTKKSIVFTLLIIIAVAGCKKDKDQVTIPTSPTNEPEVMTTFKFTFIDSAGLAPTVTAEYRDPDGDGGNLFVQFDTIKLQTNKTYLTSVLILDETKNPVDTTSNEVLAEANDHLFFYTATGTNTAITILDYDTHPTPLPIGLHTKWKTTGASTGTTHVVLRHQPGVKDGSYAPGETDIDLTFQTKIE
jgi:hypothetical protein